MSWRLQRGGSGSADPEDARHRRSDRSRQAKEIHARDNRLAGIAAAVPGQGRGPAFQGPGVDHAYGPAAEVDDTRIDFERRVRAVAPRERDLDLHDPVRGPGPHSESDRAG